MGRERSGGVLSKGSERPCATKGRRSGGREVTDGETQTDAEGGYQTR